MLLNGIFKCIDKNDGLIFCPKNTFFMNGKYGLNVFFYNSWSQVIHYEFICVKVYVQNFKKKKYKQIIKKTIIFTEEYKNIKMFEFSVVGCSNFDCYVFFVKLKEKLLIGHYY